MRVLVFLLIFGLFVGSTDRAEAQEVLEGMYFGVDDATGAAILITPDEEGFVGTFFDPSGASQDFEADRVNDTAEAVLGMDNRTVLMRMVPLPFGAQVALIPFDGDGRLLLGASRTLGFVREGVQLPQKPADFQPAPRDPTQRIAGNAFVSSYQFWEPVGVRNGYLALPDRFRTLMRLFPAVQLDVIWKLCLAPGADTALATALRGQGLDCTEVIDGIATTQREGRFAEYKREVEGDRRALQSTVRCADGYIESKETCDASAERLAKAAISLRTAQMVLESYR